MTQNGGIDVLVAWCAFGVLLLLLAWTVLRHHEDPAELSRRSRRDAQSSGPSRSRPEPSDAAPPGADAPSDAGNRRGGGST